VNAHQPMRSRLVTLGILLYSCLSLSTCGPTIKGLDNHEEDRPPIVVKGGSIILEHADKKTPWKGGGRKWQPDHNRGKSVHVYVVTVETEKKQLLCGPYAGVEVEISAPVGGRFLAVDRPRRNGVPFAKREPRIKAEVDITKDPNQPWRLVARGVLLDGATVATPAGSCVVDSEDHLIFIRPQ
jgi:hypothetical protein